jgi:hypothetical protein
VRGRPDGERWEGSARKVREQELIDPEHKWLWAISHNDTGKLERIAGPEQTLTGNGSPGGRTRLDRQEEWMATVPAYEVHSHEFRDIVVRAYDGAPWFSPALTCG